MEFCTSCGCSTESDFCNFCKESAISLFEAGINNFCWYCGAYLENFSICPECKKSFNDLEEELFYTQCEICKINIDPHFNCPYHEECKTSLEWKVGFIINIFHNSNTLAMYLNFKCPYNKNYLLKEPLSNGKIRLSHKSTLILKLKSENDGQEYEFDGYNFINNRFSFKKLSQKRFQKILNHLPEEMIVKKHPHIEIFEGDIKKWLDNIVF